MSFSPPPAKRASISPPGGHENNFSPPPTEMSSDSSPNSQENGLSPEQKSRMERNRLEAEAKVIAKKFGTKEMGLSWVKALLPEFKKPYMQEVIPLNIIIKFRAAGPVYMPRIHRLKQATFLFGSFAWFHKQPENSFQTFVMEGEREFS